MRSRVILYTSSPALACIIGARRAWTVEMISSEEMPCRWWRLSTGANAPAGAVRGIAIALPAPRPTSKQSRGSCRRRYKRRDRDVGIALVGVANSRTSEAVVSGAAPGLRRHVWRSHDAVVAPPRSGAPQGRR
jgi:hypothetical protein